MRIYQTQAKVLLLLLATVVSPLAADTQEFITGELKQPFEEDIKRLLKADYNARLRRDFLSILPDDLPTPGCREPKMVGYRQIYPYRLADSKPPQPIPVDPGFLLLFYCADGRYWIKDETQPEPTEPLPRNIALKYPCPPEKVSDGSCQAELALRVLRPEPGRVIYRPAYHVTELLDIDQEVAKTIPPAIYRHLATPSKPQWVSYWTTHADGFKSDMVLLEDYSGYQGRLLAHSPIGTEGSNTLCWKESPLEGATIAEVRSGYISTTGSDGLFSLLSRDFSPFSGSLENEQFEILSSDTDPPTVTSLTWKQPRANGDYFFHPSSLFNGSTPQDDEQGCLRIASPPRHTVLANTYLHLKSSITYFDSLLPLPEKLTPKITVEDKSDDPFCAARATYRTKINLPFRCDTNSQFIPKGLCPHVIAHEASHILTNRLAAIASGGRWKSFTNITGNKALSDAISDYLSTSFHDDPAYGRVCKDERRHIDTGLNERNATYYRSWLLDGPSGKVGTSLKISGALWKIRESLMRRSSEENRDAWRKFSDLLVLLSVLWGADDPHCLGDLMIFFANDIFRIDTSPICDSFWNKHHIFVESCSSSAARPMFRLSNARLLGPEIEVSGSYHSSSDWPRYRVVVTGITSDFKTRRDLTPESPTALARTGSTTGRLLKAKIPDHKSAYIEVLLQPSLQDSNLNRRHFLRESCGFAVDRVVSRSIMSTAHYRDAAIRSTKDKGNFVLAVLREDNQLESWFTRDLIDNGENARPFRVDETRYISGQRLETIENNIFLRSSGMEPDLILDSHKGLVNAHDGLENATSEDEDILRELRRLKLEAARPFDLKMIYGESLATEILDNLPVEVQLDLAKIVISDEKEILLAHQNEKLVAFEIGGDEPVKKVEPPQLHIEVTDEPEIRIFWPEKQATLKQRRIRIPASRPGVEPYHINVKRSPDASWEDEFTVALSIEGHALIVPLDPDGDVIKLHTTTPSGEITLDLGRLAVGNEHPISHGDVDADGENEILLGSFQREFLGQRHHRIYAFKLDGSVVAGQWPIQLAEPTTAPVLVADLNNDGCIEVITISNRIEIRTPDFSPKKCKTRVKTTLISGECYKT